MNDIITLFLTKLVFSMYREGHNIIGAETIAICKARFGETCGCYSHVFVSKCLSLYREKDV